NNNNNNNNGNNNSNNSGNNNNSNNNDDDNNNTTTDNNSSNNNMPKMIKQSILLLINLLVLKCTIPTIEDFSEFIENLPLCKLYIKYYYYHNNKYHEFYKRLIHLHQLCYEFINKPLSLKLLTRNKIRKQIGGIDFYKKINNIDLPRQLITFIQYINYEQFVIMNDIPKQLIQLIQGEWIDINSTISCNNNNNNKLEESMNIFNQSNDLEQINNNNHDNEEQLTMNNNNSLQRGRASERQHIHMYQRRINKQKQPLRPTSAPLFRTFVR
ncbi:unnamed protein product, partial [Schistosoma margrebowiei]